MYYSGSYSPRRRSRNLDMHAGSFITIILIRQTSYRDLMSHIPPQMSAIASANHQNPGGSTSARMMETDRFVIVFPPVSNVSQYTKRV